jgi:signal transduction histidine kinase
MPTEAVLRRLAELGDDAVVFTPGYFADGDGRVFTPREAAQAMAAVAAAPMFAPLGPFIGTGVVGGYMPDFVAMGRQAGQTAAALLDGTPPASLRVPDVTPSVLNIDWRQVDRWGFDASAVPADATVHFREPSLLEAHRIEVVFAFVVFLLQAALITGLLVERRRRRVAELAVQAQRSELAHASRLAVAGELTGAIAHEINQPLGAILSNADTAELLLESGTDRRDELRAILADIRRDDLRASEVIRRLRALLAKNEFEREPLGLNDVVGELAPVLRAEARRRGVTLDLRPAASAATIIGDRIQIQQVLINLVLNAMDAVAEAPEDRRAVVVAVETAGKTGVITVRDRGHGIAAEHLPKVFDSFFTTKRKGMGLGLSIVRTLVEAHGGRVRAENGPGEGTVFRVELPLAGAQPARASGPA